MRKRWSRLRDYFQRNHKQLTILKSGSEAGHKSRKWFLYDALAFLIPFLTTKATNNVTVEDLDNSFTENAAVKSPSAASIASTSENMLTQNIEEQPQPALQEEPMSDFRGVRKRKFQEEWFPSVSSFDMEMMEALKDLRAGVLHSSSRVESNKDEDELYCLSLVPKMKTLDTVSKLECQAEMNIVLAKYIKRAKTSANEAN